MSSDTPAAVHVGGDCSDTVAAPPPAPQPTAVAKLVTQAGARVEAWRIAARGARAAVQDFVGLLATARAEAEADKERREPGDFMAALLAAAPTPELRALLMDGVRAFQEPRGPSIADKLSKAALEVQERFKETEALCRGLARTAASLRQLALESAQQGGPPEAQSSAREGSLGGDADAEPRGADGCGAHSAAAASDKGDSGDAESTVVRSTLSVRGRDGGEVEVGVAEAALLVGSVARMVTRSQEVVAAVCGAVAPDLSQEQFGTYLSVWEIDPFWDEDTAAALSALCAAAEAIPITAEAS